MKTSKGWDARSSSARSRSCERAFVKIATAAATSSVGTILGSGAFCRRKQILFRSYQSGPSSFGAAFGTVNRLMNRRLTRHVARNHIAIREVDPRYAPKREGDARDNTKI